ncbi:hypothetical protein ACWDTP_03985 [Mycobacterium sp. NPDC003449]
MVAVRGVPIVFAEAGDLLDAVDAEFASHGIAPVYAGAPCVSGAPSGPEAPDDVDSIMVVIDHRLVESLFGDTHFSAAKRRARSCENEVCDLATGTAVAHDARRLLIVGDGRWATTDEKARLIRWIRNAMLRIGYECAINGLVDLATSYAIVVAGTDVGRAAQCLVGWQRRAGPSDITRAGGAGARMGSDRYPGAVLR